MSTISLSPAAPNAPVSAIELRAAEWRFSSGASLWPTPIDLTLLRQRTGLVGRNGSGKSLLCALVAGDRSPTSGSVDRHGPVCAVGQEPSGETAADLAGLGAPFAALRRIEAGKAAPADWDLADGQWDLPGRWDSALREARLPPIRPNDDASLLSGGQRQRVALDAVFLRQGTFLVLDEPSNHLDASAHDWLLAKMTQWPTGLLIASHDRALLRGMDRIIEIDANGPQLRW